MRAYPESRHPGVDSVQPGPVRKELFSFHSFLGLTFHQSSITIFGRFFSLLARLNPKKYWNHFIEPNFQILHFRSTRQCIISTVCINGRVGRLEEAGLPIYCCTFKPAHNFHGLKVRPERRRAFKRRLSGPTVNRSGRLWTRRPCWAGPEEAGNSTQEDIGFLLTSWVLMSAWAAKGIANAHRGPRSLGVGPDGLKG